MKTLNAYRIMLVSYLAVLLVLLYGTLSNAPAGSEGTANYAVGVLWWLIKVLPFLLFIPGLIKRSHKAAAWLSYMAILSFAVLVGLGSFTAASLCIVLFLSSMLYTRWAKADAAAVNQTAATTHE